MAFDWFVIAVVLAGFAVMFFVDNPKAKLGAAVSVIAALLGYIWTRPKPELKPTTPKPFDPEPIRKEHRETDLQIRELDEAATANVVVDGDVDMSKLNRLRAKLERHRRESMSDD